MSDIGWFSPVFEGEIKRIITVHGERVAERDATPIYVTPVYRGYGDVYGLRVEASREAVNELVKTVSGDPNVNVISLYVVYEKEPCIAVFTLSSDDEEHVWERVGKIMSIHGVESVDVLKSKGGMSVILPNPWIFPPRIAGRKLVMIPETVFSELTEKRDLPNKLARHLLEVLGADRLSVHEALQLLEVLGYCRVTSVVENDSVTVSIEPAAPHYCIFCTELIGALTGRNTRAMHRDKCMITVER